jgi:putative peptide zinc metalloprotease protein
MVTDKVEIREQEFCSERYYVIRNTLKDTYIRLDEKGFYLWKLMDGKHSLTDIIMESLLKFGSPPISQLFDLLATLESNFFLVKPESDLYGLIYERTEAKSVAHRSARLIQKLSQGEISIDADGYFDWLYRNGGWIFFAAPTLAILAAISAIGSILFLQQFLHAGDVLSSYSGGAWLGAIGLFVCNYALAVFHEHGHGLAVKASGRKVIKGGFMLYLGAPCFFVDTTDMWLGTKNQRIAVSWAGPFVTMIIASICSIAVAFFPSSGFVPLLFMISVLGMFSMLMNLNPLLEWDGYYMLMNYLEMPGLRAKSLAFIKGEFLQRLSAGRISSISFSHEEKIFVVFGMMSAIWSVVFICMIPSLWANAIYPVFQIVWQEEGIGVKIVLAAAGILIMLSLASSIVVALSKVVKSIKLMHRGEER